MEKILVLRGGALGDFIVSLPALALLRDRWPQARIELTGNVTAAQLAAARGLLDAVHSQHEARWAALFGDAPLPPPFREWLETFDLVLSYWPDTQGEIGRRFPLHPDQRFTSAPAMPLLAPAAAHYCEPLRALGIEPRNYFYPLLPLNPVAPRASAGNLPLLTQRARANEDLILIHPGSGSPRKNWPAENWRRLINHLSAPVSLILGEAELPAWSSFAEKRLGDNSLHLVNPPLEELVDRLSRCRLFLGHDSGVSHLAAACGTRCVLLFGPTEPAMWAPPAPNVRVLRCEPDLVSLSLEAVRSAAAEALADQT